MALGEQLREVMGHLPTGVTIVSTRAADGSPHGATVNSVTSVSLEPPLLLVSLNRESETLAAIRETGAFTVNVLAEHQVDASSNFAGKGGTAKANGFELVAENGGAPDLVGSIAHLRCTVDRIVPAGDHELVLGAVGSLDVNRPDAPPLLFFRGGYSGVRSLEGGNGGGRTRVVAERRPFPPDVPTVAIVGGGFSGAMTAVHMLRADSTGDLRVVLVERGPRVGPGLAYSTPCSAHRLNVPAGQMSAFPREPDHFLRWARREDPSIGRTSFVQRGLYGRYLEDTLAEAERGAGPGIRLDRVRDEVVAAEEIELPRKQARLRLRSGAELLADAVVLATGNARPADPPNVDPELFGSERYLADPWDQDALGRCTWGGTVILLGTGLTMVDVALTLAASAANPRFRAISRHGLLPRVHADPLGLPRAPSHQPGPRDLRSLLAHLLVDSAAVTDSGKDPLPVLDALRPHTNSLWESLSARERRWFLEHLARLWEVHRHRMAPEVGLAIDLLRSSERLRVDSGHIHSLRSYDSGVELQLRSDEGQVRTIHGSGVVNCTGPMSDVTASAEPFLASLLEAGRARPDDLRLGLDVDDAGALLDRGGERSRRFFTVGPLRKGRLWETTAVPELRVQAEELAARLGAMLRSAAEARSPIPANG